MAVVSITGDTNEIELILDELGKEELLDPNDLQNSTKIFINGNWIGIHHKGANLIRKLKICKRRGQFSRETSIVYDILNREIKIYTDAGRVQRPLFVTEEGSKDAQGNRMNQLRIKPHHI